MEWLLGLPDIEELEEVVPLHQSEKTLEFSALKLAYWDFFVDFISLKRLVMKW